MVFFSYGIKNPKACTGTLEVFGDERKDWEGWLGVRFGNAILVLRILNPQVFAIDHFYYNFDKVIFFYFWQSVIQCYDPYIIQTYLHCLMNHAYFFAWMSSSQKTFKITFCRLNDSHLFCCFEIDRWQHIIWTDSVLWREKKRNQKRKREEREKKKRKQRFEGVFQSTNQSNSKPVWGLHVFKTN